MRYLLTHLDEQNIAWFNKDVSYATLKSIQLIRGKLRGLYPFCVEFSYPISVISGENCSGKSTFLSIAACAFHNKTDGYKPIDKHKTYYTFRDFFIQAKDESPPEGIKIKYGILHNKWQGGRSGLGHQNRTKMEGGRWTKYDKRVKRNVVFMGIKRVVPHNEMVTYRSYRRAFSPGNKNEIIYERIRVIAGNIIGKDYSGFSIHQHSKYRLPVVDTSSLHYSGFNMGAGEIAIFGILSTLFEAGPGTLLIIDEIELGLHEKAQKRLIGELKTLCNELHCQVICSTHSPVILKSLPPQARFFIESQDETTVIIPEITAEYACGLLAGTGSGELDIFVEDDVAKAFIEEILSLTQRQRVRVIPVGSSEAVLRQLAARYREGRANCVVFLDGDKQVEQTRAAKNVKKYLETNYGTFSEQKMDTWVKDRLYYLPGKTWPEKWLIDQALSCPNRSELQRGWGTGPEKIRGFLTEALRAGKHKEFHKLHEMLHRDKDQVCSDIIRYVKNQRNDLIQPVLNTVKNLLVSLL